MNHEQTNNCNHAGRWHWQDRTPVGPEGIGKGGIRIHHHKLREHLIQTAEHEGIPYQSGIMHGGTDASAMMQSKSGIPAVTMGVPRRYSHTPVEVFDLNDLKNLVKILVSALQKIDKDFRIHRT